MQALHDIVQAGYARYIGMSSCYAWQFQLMQRGSADFVLPCSASLSLSLCLQSLSLSTHSATRTEA
jgi:aryl-alcohol dehydrogenase-like predicted oxidoreductase